MSLNPTVAQSYHSTPPSAAVKILWFNRIVVVISAGNNGTSTLYPPVHDPFMITVGATDDKKTVSTADDTIATFSAYCLTESGFPKPGINSRVFFTKRFEVALKVCDSVEMTPADRPYHRRLR